MKNNKLECNQKQKVIKYDIELEPISKDAKRVVDRLNKIHNKYPFTMMKYAEEVMKQVEGIKPTLRGKRKDKGD